MAGPQIRQRVLPLVATGVSMRALLLTAFVGCCLPCLLSAQTQTPPQTQPAIVVPCEMHFVPGRAIIYDLPRSDGIRQYQAGRECGITFRTESFFRTLISATFTSRQGAEIVLVARQGRTIESIKVDGKRLASFRKLKESPSSWPLKVKPHRTYVINFGSTAPSAPGTPH